MFDDFDPDFPQHDDIAEIDAIIAEVWGEND